MDPASALFGSARQMADRVIAHNHQALATLPLPVEVRLMIYEHVFSKSYVVIWRSRGVSAKSLNILRVSSATRKEASEVLYGRSTFLFDVSSYHPVSRQIYTQKTSGLRNAGIKLHNYKHNNAGAGYTRVTAITDRLIRALTSNCQLQRLDILTRPYTWIFAWSRLVRLETFNLLCRCKGITIHAQTWEPCLIDDDTDEDAGGEADPFGKEWNVLRRHLGETLGHDIQINVDRFYYMGDLVFKATVRTNGAAA